MASTSLLLQLSTLARGGAEFANTRSSEQHTIRPEYSLTGQAPPNAKPSALQVRQPSIASCRQGVGRGGGLGSVGVDSAHGRGGLGGGDGLGGGRLGGGGLGGGRLDGGGLRGGRRRSERVRASVRVVARITKGFWLVELRPEARVVQRWVRVA